MDEIDENSDILQKCDELLEIIDDEEIQEIEVVDEFANKLDPVKKEIHLFCFISNAVKNQPVDLFENFEGVA